MAFDLTGRTALVTGASRGLGRGIARCLAMAGADVAVSYLGSRDQADSAVAEIQALGRRAFAVQGDVGREADVRRIFDRLSSEFNGVDILVNNAGINSDFNIYDMTVEEWQRILNTNLTGNFLCAKYAVEMMRPRRYGRIIQISSVVGQQGALYGHVHYAATKGGQLSFTKTLARTVAADGITVNAIAPGVHITEQVEAVLGKENATTRLDAVLKAIPAGHFGSVEDIGWTAVFLSSAEAGYITGATFDVNGGLSMR